MEIAEMPRTECEDAKIVVLVNDARQNLSKKGWCMMSSAVTINSLSWMLCINNANGNHIGATLYLGGMKDSTRCVYAECKIKLVSAEPRYSVVREFCNDFCRGCRGMGFENMLTLVNVLDPAKKFIIKNRFIAEARITCGSLRKVFPETRHGEFDPVLLSFNRELITDRAEYFMLSEVGADCEFSVGSHPNVGHIRACKAILAKASEVFQAMFFGSFQSDGVIRVSDIEPEVFYAMLRHIYGSKWTLESRQQAVDLYYVANKYMIEELKSSCVQFLWPYSISDAWVSLEISSVYDLDHLEEATMRIIRRNTDKVLKREEFQSLSRQCVVKILQQTELSVVSELDIFDAVLRWGRAQCTNQGKEKNGENLRLVMGETIQLIRFLAMTPEQFATSPCSSGILTCQEMNIIFRRLVTKDQGISVSNLCSFSYPRKKCGM